ncbi:hypothetical protein [Allosphingosinicella deserti]|uniref:Lipoprotein n=1 Tax=Allosphingosinicella deserti TaxID=2116704 RepID=A0A2P7QZG2_9SPHN|nr:hypothetical protein [Sphingomonas deserti]PSJ43346.1 hypothetical protein C7I55_02980 [Sphingomonas deserti]
MRKVLLAAALLALVGCDTRAAIWTAWVYEDWDNRTKSERLTGFKTFEQCQEAAISRLRSYPEPDGGDYECGYKCEYKPSMQTNVCKETRK